MSTLQLFWTTLAAIVAATICNLAARSLREFSRHDLEEICRRREKPERFTNILQEHDRVGLGIEILSVVLAVFSAVAGSAWTVARGGSDLTSGLALLGTAAVLALVLVTSMVWVSRAVARVFSEEFLYHSWPLWKLLAVVVSPLTWGAHMLDITLHRLAGRELHDEEDERIEEEIRTIVSEGHREGLLEEEAREMIEGVIDLSDADVAEIMTPRTDMNMLSIHLDWEALIASAIETGHTRIPVYDKNRDDIIGVLYTKDLLPELATGDIDSRTPIRELLRKPVFVPETKPVHDLLQMLQQLRTHVAVVLDEYGGVSGLVTIEDVVEEIVGEIIDEYDEEVAEEIRQIDDNTCEALGKAHIDEINDRLNIQLPEDADFDTIGGLVFSELGRVPVAGESLIWQEQVEIHVLEATRRRIERVRVQRLGDDQRESA
ncbi:hemolysin family protein [Bythopirellula goksoeyrii]|uniref:Hemolysin C n=1 Tax=Bythopirellula goksoeyrii TaxID=1400387 RepID=A0A5B9QA21_9BACT|nr:hemolysin family protein [Bythopirellula goksoeyrii]QEG34292.1 Hemolysin C [Bythopirellula goksoeyrii]